MKNIFTIFILLLLLTLISTSTAQINWTKYVENPIFSDTTGGWASAGFAFAPFVIIIDSTYHMWYCGSDGSHVRIGYATSSDGITWVPYANNPVLDVVAESWEETRVSDPTVIYDGSTFHMWYTGMRAASPLWDESIGYATSPDGINWTKYANNPVFEKGVQGSWDDAQIWHCSLYSDGSIYHMWYSGKSSNDNRKIGYATSPDGIAWTRYVNNPVLSPGSSGNWDYPEVRCPRVLVEGSKYHMFYSAGIWHEWSIGYATSENGINWTKYGNSPVLNKGLPGSWDAYYIMNTSVVIDTANSIFRMWYHGGAQRFDAHIGYATALEVLSYAYYIKPHLSFVRLAIDTLTITADVSNHHNHNLHVAALINTLDDVFVDSISMFDDGNHSDSLAGDDLYGCYLNPLSSEDVFTISASVTDLDSNRYHILTNASRFTTIGPIVFDSYTLTPSFGTSYRLYLNLRNNGLLATAKNVTANISTTDSAVTSITNNSGGFGDIDAGQTKASTGYYTLYTANLQAIDTLKFYIKIISDGYEFWQDTTDVVAGLSENESNIPKIYSLSQNYPNPFNPTTTIEFGLPKSEFVSLKIYNLLGQEVATLVSDKLITGNYKYTWDSSGFSSGVYYYRMITNGGFVQTKKLIVLR